MKKLLTLLIIIALLVFAGSPFFTAYQLKQAYDKRDGDTIASSINYPQLTDNLKHQLNSRFSNTVSQYPIITQLGGDDITQFANQFINHAVDGAITTDNIAATVRSDGQQANTETKELAAAWAIASNKIDLKALLQDLLVQRGNLEAVLQKQIKKLSHAQTQELSQHIQSGEDSTPSFSYCGINCFKLSGDVKGYPLTVEMQRSGFLEWKIINIELP